MTHTEIGNASPTTQTRAADIQQGFKDTLKPDSFSLEEQYGIFK